MPTTRLLIARHGETLANREFRYIGSRDDPLSERGQVQAVQLAEALAVLPVSAVYSSPLQRAYNTAIPIAGRHALQVQQLDALRECSFGAWEGMSHAEVLALGPQDVERLQAWERDANVAPPGGESFESVRQRVCDGMDQLALAHPDQAIVLVSHVGPIKTLLCTALNAPLSSSTRVFLDPATISVIDWRDRQHATVRLVNSHAHLGWQEARWMQ